MIANTVYNVLKNFEILDNKSKFIPNKYRLAYQNIIADSPSHASYYTPLNNANVIIKLSNFFTINDIDNFLIDYPAFDIIRFNENIYIEKFVKLIKDDRHTKNQRFFLFKTSLLTFKGLDTINEICEEMCNMSTLKCKKISFHNNNFYKIHDGADCEFYIFNSSPNLKWFARTFSDDETDFIEQTYFLTTCSTLVENINFKEFKILFENLLKRKSILSTFSTDPLYTFIDMRDNFVKFFELEQHTFDKDIVRNDICKIISDKGKYLTILVQYYSEINMNDVRFMIKNYLFLKNSYVRTICNKTMSKTNKLLFIFVLKQRRDIATCECIISPNRFRNFLKRTIFRQHENILYLQAKKEHKIYKLHLGIFFIENLNTIFLSAKDLWIHHHTSEIDSSRTKSTLQIQTVELNKCLDFFKTYYELAVGKSYVLFDYKQVKLTQLCFINYTFYIFQSNDSKKINMCEYLTMFFSHLSPDNFQRYPLKVLIKCMNKLKTFAPI